MHVVDDSCSCPRRNIVFNDDFKPSNQQFVSVKTPRYSVKLLVVGVQGIVDKKTLDKCPCVCIVNLYSTGIVPVIAADNGQHRSVWAVLDVTGVSPCGHVGEHRFAARSVVDRYDVIAGLHGHLGTVRRPVKFDDMALCYKGRQFFSSRCVPNTDQTCCWVVKTRLCLTETRMQRGVF